MSNKEAKTLGESSAAPNLFQKYKSLVFLSALLSGCGASQSGESRGPVQDPYFRDQRFYYEYALNECGTDREGKQKGTKNVFACAKGLNHEETKARAISYLGVHLKRAANAENRVNQGSEILQECRAGAWTCLRAKQR